MWDGDGCPCDTFDLDRDNLPTDGIFTIEIETNADRGQADEG